MPQEIHPDDIRVSPVLDLDDAKSELHGLAVTLVACTHAQTHGVFVARWGDGWAVFLRKYASDDSGSAG